MTKKHLNAKTVSTLTVLSLFIFCFFALIAEAREPKKEPVLKPQNPPYRTWLTTDGKDHPLAGNIWSTKHKVFLSPRELSDALSIHDFILLGEVHDNPDHHRLQAWLMNKIVSHNRKPVVVMEMISEAQQQSVDEFLEKARPPKKKSKPKGGKKAKKPPQKQPKKKTPRTLAAEFGPAIGWNKTGWPKWEFYQPIARSAFAHRLKFAYGTSSKETYKAIGKKGFDGIDAADARRLTLDQNIDSALVKDLLKELEASHCNMVKGQPLRAMAKVQQFKDALMADQMMTKGKRRGAFLIAGNGHVRTDRGVPFFLKRQDPYYLSTSLMLLEVKEDAKVPQDLVPVGPKGQPAADFVWFTPGKKRADQCEKLKKHFSKTKNRKHKSKTKPKE